MAEPEVALAGGNTTTGVVRVGDAVRRPAGPWSPAVHDLLVHLRAVGFDGAPRSLGFDERGRHVLEHVPGAVSMPFRTPDPPAALLRVGRLLRDFHDASAEHVPAADAVWNVVVPPDRTDLVVHHDAAPWNLVLSPDRWVLIDWDTAAPGSRVWDLAYAAHGFVPLAPATPPRRAGRLLAALAEGYGLAEQERRDLVGLLRPRIAGMHALLERGHRDGTEPWARLWSEGHGEVWRADAEFAAEREQALLRALLGGG